MKQEAKVRTDEVEVIEKHVAFRRKANAECNQLLARNKPDNQTSVNRANQAEVDSLRPASIIEFEASQVRCQAEALRGHHFFMGINDMPSLNYHSFRATSYTARLGVLSPGNHPGPAFDPPQSIQESYQKFSPIGMPESPVAWSD
jgi:hypothetical protein